MSAACSILNYSKKKELKDDKWKLRKLNCNVIGKYESSTAFVYSELERELLIQMKIEEGNKYTIIADITKGNELSISLGNGAYSYDSCFAWNSYEDRMNNIDCSDYDIQTDDDVYVYDDIYMEGGFGLNGFFGFTNGK